MAASSAVFLSRFLMASLGVGVASLGYGLVQALGGDPFDWVNPYSPVFGFLGNPNFQSSFAALALIPTAVLFWNAKYKYIGSIFFYQMIKINLVIKLILILLIIQG